jgi:hypothetical protein
MTNSEELTLVDAAIEAILGGAQSYSIAGRSMTRADLETLFARRDYLVAMVARETRGGIRVRGVTPV